ncbi:hypothetical protein EIP91_001825 [Steccherinum ochraceum]|uniref:Mid2 domain-containing protein n=1 Tax=Steccherinum ochraceum TaxID=92696 RepID=A0A4R0S2T4_9APHY|nr:hypothetical protein EIP91_001825 [Steccherinum ochraceum]
MEIDTSLPAGPPGQPPYHLLFVPLTSSPYANAYQLDFATDSTEVSFVQTFPSDTPYVIVGSDGSSFSSGGTTNATNVASGTVTDCLADKSSSRFDWSITTVNSCAPAHVSWDNAHGIPSFYGIIPGGQSFIIPQDRTSTANGFDWISGVAPGSTFYIIGNDDRGPGTGGVQRVDVALSLTPTNAPCPNPSGLVQASTTSSSSSSEPTSTGDGTQVESSNKRSALNAGVIAGGIVGGVVGLGLILLSLFLWHRLRRSKHTRPVDLVYEGDSEVGAHSPSFPHTHTNPDPYFVWNADISAATDSTTAISASDRQLDVGQSESETSGTSAASDFAAALLPPTTTGSRKGASLLKNVRVVMHEDSGFRPEGGENLEEVVELPPAYTNLKPVVVAAAQRNATAPDTLSESREGRSV